jgi:hypothetical protein
MNDTARKERLMRRGIPAAVVALAVALVGASSVQAIQIGGGAQSAEVTAEVTPDRLPRGGFAPVGLIVRGTINAADAGALDTIELRLDRQLHAIADVRGLSTCAPGQVRSVPLAQAQRRCGKALIGSGKMHKEFFPDSEIQFSLRQTVLLFNAGPGRVVVYTFEPRVGTFVPAAPVTSGAVTGRSIQLRFLRAAGGVTTSFHFRIGRTWRDRGRQRSYLVGRCAGRFANRLTLRLGRTTLAGTVTDPCRGR